MAIDEIFIKKARKLAERFYETCLNLGHSKDSIDLILYPQWLKKFNTEIIIEQQCKIDDLEKRIQKLESENYMNKRRDKPYAL
jgi:hypothetical protein